MPRGSRTDLADRISLAIQLLRRAPRRTVDLADELDLSRRAAEKLIEALRRTWVVETEERGRERWHQITGPIRD
jgi:predicted ArsR family transcriptional regulator